MPISNNCWMRVFALRQRDKTSRISPPITNKDHALLPNQNTILDHVTNRAGWSDAGRRILASSQSCSFISFRRVSHFFVSHCLAPDIVWVTYSTYFLSHEQDVPMWLTIPVAVCLRSLRPQKGIGLIMGKVLEQFPCRFGQRSTSDVTIGLAGVPTPHCRLNCDTSKSLHFFASFLLYSLMNTNLNGTLILILGFRDSIIWSWFQFARHSFTFSHIDIT